jgi:hypothetical protein
VPPTKRQCDIVPVNLFSRIAERDVARTAQKTTQYQLDRWSEWQDLNLRPPRPERGFHTQKSEIIAGFGFQYTQLQMSAPIPPPDKF